MQLQAAQPSPPPWRPSDLAWLNGPDAAGPGTAAADDQIVLLAPLTPPRAEGDADGPELVAPLVEAVGAGVVLLGGGARKRESPRDADAGRAPKRPRRPPRLVAADRARRARIAQTVEGLRELAGFDERADKAAVLEAAAAELERLRAENRDLEGRLLRAGTAQPPGAVAGTAARSPGLLAEIDRLTRAAAAGQLYRNMFQDASAGLLCTDWRTGVVLDTNRVLGERLGFERDRVVGRRWVGVLAAQLHKGNRALSPPCPSGRDMMPLERLLDGGGPPCRRGGCSSFSCQWREAELALVRGTREVISRPRPMVCARGRTVTVLVTRWLVRDPATREPRYFMTLGQVMESGGG